MGSTRVIIIFFILLFYTKHYMIQCIGAPTIDKRQQAPSPNSYDYMLTV